MSAKKRKFCPSYGLHVGDVVRPCTNEDAAAIAATFHDGDPDPETEYEILIVVALGEDYHGICRNGYVLRPVGYDKRFYPFVWNAARVYRIREKRPSLVIPGAWREST